ncbi:hypothetical protein AMTR_s00011p00254250 [Amborella trichopoda]|uniref:AB hydrolase-1 domain-containing protein n=1 Tax=Amborella trichopoda TaxID=13333 RepID=W1NG36_AMBTC|nr:hypothetical protein AMTR_s00011p00254250 [Amborella trichopoda]
MVTCLFQVLSRSKRFSIYVPDLVFFGGSVTSSSDYSASFQAHCLAKALNKLRVQKYALVGFSYGGMVAFKMAELYPEVVSHLVISGAVSIVTDTISGEITAGLDISSFKKLLLPTNVKGLKAMFSVATHKQWWLPNCLYRDYLEVGLSFSLSHQAPYSSLFSLTRFFSFRPISLSRSLHTVISESTPDNGNGTGHVHQQRTKD